ncbi:Lrp/AsnC family transcriptional regulator [Clostridium sp. SM-530-WT-3G]|uniref:Lrp/AsnC family transcriptional regulator n=1 Tax=Clostridium sp. SM-530-WT-3G TaxID=2725303 RepID=UPI00145FC81D|nr:Lrp/AsnC family transcriptional regulator [Clostridium sp. SM-530-WT-3G]NME84278.1 Lrp/AsnC family transcriptional regulator [Clostridium sp. SM-530-WT-3G]
MDKIDYKIIELLQKNARYPLKHLAEEVYLSTPAVSARIEKLEEAGIIRGYSVDVNPLKLGYNIKAFINLEMSPKQKPEFYPFIAACPNVIECNCVTGKYSMLIKVAYHTTLELDAFIGELQKFGNTETQIVFSTPVEHRGINLNADLDLEEK